MENFLDIDHLKLNQEYIIGINRYIAGNEIEAAIKKLPKKQSIGTDRSTTELYHTFKEEQVLTLFKKGRNMAKLIL
jgi:hypothetical protein